MQQPKRKPTYRRGEPLKPKDVYRYHPEVRHTNGYLYQFGPCSFDKDVEHTVVRYVNLKLPGCYFDVIFDGRTTRTDVREQARRALFDYLGNAKIVRPKSMHSIAYSYSVNVYRDLTDIDWLNPTNDRVACGISNCSGFRICLPRGGIHDWKYKKKSCESATTK